MGAASCLILLRTAKQRYRAPQPPSPPRRTASWLDPKRQPCFTAIGQQAAAQAFKRRMTTICLQPELVRRGPPECLLQNCRSPFAAGNLGHRYLSTLVRVGRLRSLLDLRRTLQNLTDAGAAADAVSVIKTKPLKAICLVTNCHQGFAQHCRWHVCNQNATK